MPIGESPAGKIRQTRYEDLTAAEQAGMEAFLVRWLAGEQHEATRANLLALDMEHLISTFPLDPTLVDDDMRSQLKELVDDFHSLTGITVQLHVLGDR